MSWLGRISILLVIRGSGRRKWTHRHPCAQLFRLVCCIPVIYRWCHMQVINR